MAESNSTSARRRVKLYLLNDERQWDDRGTGHVSYAIVDRLQGMSLIVRSEVDGSVLLESKILPDTAYQKQQETLIVWTEGDSYDLALSFQEKNGCDEIWEKICQVQGKDPSVDVTQDIVEETDDGERFEDSFGQSSHSMSAQSSSSQLELPPAEMSRLGDIEAMFASDPGCGGGGLTPIRRERLANAVEREGYALKLIELFHMCEDLENVDGLHKLYNIFKSMFLLNKIALFEAILADEDRLMDVVGVFEYDPSKPEPTHHREYLRTKARFRDVLPLAGDGSVGSERWEKLVKTIHQTYRVQYIQDVILPSPSMFEENMLSALNSFVFFNKVEIVKMLQEDGEILKTVFRKLADDGTADEKRRELVLFLKEFCSFSNTLQPMNRDEFFKTLSSLGILETLASIWTLDDPDAKAAATDIFSFIVESNPSMVREFALQEARNDVNDDDMLVNMAIDQMKCDPDPELGGAMQLMATLRILLDPENMLANAMKAEKSEFLSCFYKHCMPVLTAPLLANTTDDRPSRDDYQTAQLLGLILDLLTFCVEHHSFHIRAYLIGRDLLRRVLVLTKSRNSFLVLNAVRFLRRLVQLKDDTYFRYIIKNNHFHFIEEAFAANGSRYNLINSAIIELFEYIRTEDLKTLYCHIVEHHFKAFESVSYVQTFKSLALKCEQQQERLREKSGTSAVSTASTPSPGAGLESKQGSRFRRDAHYVDADEEIWFDKDEEYETATADGLDTKMESEISELSKLLESRKAKEAGASDLDATPPRLFQRSPSITIAPLRLPSPGPQPVIGGDTFVMASGSVTSSVNGTGGSGSPTGCGSPTGGTSGNSPAGASGGASDAGAKRPLGGLVDYPDDEDENDEGVSGDDEAASNGDGSGDDDSSQPGRQPNAKKPRLGMA